VCLVQLNQKKEVAFITKSELDSLLETVYLLKSPENAKRLLSALDLAFKNKN
jgi:antitoxin YefM